MSIDEAVKSLQDYLGEPEVFQISHQEDKIFVRVNFVYRKEDILKLGGNWEGYPVEISRISCW